MRTTSFRSKRETNNGPQRTSTMTLQEGATKLGILKPTKSNRHFAGTPAEGELVGITRTRSTREIDPKRVVKDEVPLILKFDKQVRTSANASMDNCLVKALSEIPACQRICHPAEYATRQTRKVQGGGQDGGGDERRDFGLPDFDTSGFAIMEDGFEGSAFPDNHIHEQLGLHPALHSKSSVQRLCLTVAKSTVPRSTTAHDFAAMVRMLRKCDHVNVLIFYDIFEDERNLYLMYEFFPCCTLLSQLEKSTWSQEQLVNIGRECCAVSAYAHSLGMSHLSWTLCHVLLPAHVSTGGDPCFVKVFGFGLMGVLQTDSHDHLFWSPEALERYNQAGQGASSWVHKLEGPQRIMCDSWSLGALMYSLVSKQPLCETDEDVLAKRWSFNLAIDEMDSEAKSLIEGFLHPIFDKRLRADRALHHEWMRRRWQAPPGAPSVFLKCEEFVGLPIAKRLFGRFLTRFLAPEHLRQIGQRFYALDTIGNGLIMLKELEFAARDAGRPDSSAEAVQRWLAREGEQHITLMRFAECFAEEVIDGSALRHAFESLDDDGSEQISPEELYQTLRVIDASVTLQDVIAHVEAAEVGAAEEGHAVSDHQIDYGEFVQLFPVRQQRVSSLEDRINVSWKEQQALASQYEETLGDRDGWVHMIEQGTNQINDLADRSVERHENSAEVAKELKHQFNSMEAALRNVPGAIEKDENPMEGILPSGDAHPSIKTKRKTSLMRHNQEEPDGFRYDSFLKDMAEEYNWAGILAAEVKMLKQALSVASKFSGAVDQLKAHDAGVAAGLKLQDLMKQAKGQMEEYDAVVEAMADPEARLAHVRFSGRGLRARKGEGDDEPGNEADSDGDGAGSNWMMGPLLKVFKGSD